MKQIDLRMLTDQFQLHFQINQPQFNMAVTSNKPNLLAKISMSSSSPTATVVSTDLKFNTKKLRYYNCLHLVRGCWSQSWTNCLKGHRFNPRYFKHPCTKNFIVKTVLFVRSFSNSIWKKQLENKPWIMTVFNLFNRLLFHQSYKLSPCWASARPYNLSSFNLSALPVSQNILKLKLN